MTIIDLEAIELKIATLVPPLHAYVEALPDPRHAQSDHEKADIYSRRVNIQTLISRLMNHDLDKPLRQLSEAEMQLAASLAEERAIDGGIEETVTALATIVTTSAERDRLYAREQHLREQLRMLHAGTLLRGPGITFESRSALEQRIVELKEKLVRLQRRHAGFVTQAEAVLGVTQ